MAPRDKNAEKDSNVTPEERRDLENIDNGMTDDEDQELLASELDDTDEDGDPLNEDDDLTGEDLDVPGSEDDDADEEIGEEDEENNDYSLDDQEHEIPED